MTPQQTRFVAEVLNGKTLKAAYIAAGYKARGHSAEAAAERLAKTPDVAGAIAGGKKKAIAVAEERFALDAQYVLAKLVIIVEGEETRHSDRIRALELLGNHLGMWVQRVREEPQKYDLSCLSDKDKARLLEALRDARSESGEPGGS